MTDPKKSWVPVIIVALIVVVAGLGTGYYLYAYVNKPKTASAPLTVQEGDNVTVNYIGVFGSGFDEGKVFDTSLLNIATDNTSYPKAISFGFRGDAGYVPLKAHVGTQSYGNYTSLITGFWTAMVGLTTNETISTTIQPAQGYGSPVASKIQSFPLIQELPLINSYSLTQFGSAFSGIPAKTGAVFTDPHYQWQDVILSVNATEVVVENQPTVGQIVKPYGWPVLITNVSSTGSQNGTVTIQNELTPQSVGQYKGTNWVNGQTFFLSDVNPQAGTYTLDYNEEVVGNVLIFTITVYSILPPASS